MYEFSKLSKSRLEGIHPNLIKVLEEAIATSPFDFAIVDGFRTTKQQQELYASGRIVKGSIKTYKDGVKDISKHQKQNDGFGYAVDFGIYDKKSPGNINWGDLNKIRIVANHIKTVGAKYGFKIEWGGDWQNFKDYPHIQINI